LNGTERVELEKLASNYKKFEDRMGKKYHVHFCEVGDNGCEKKFAGLGGKTSIFAQEKGRY